MMLRDNLVDSVLEKLKDDFPRQSFSVEKDPKNNSTNYIVENEFGDFYANGKTESVIIKCCQFKAVVTIFTWNNESENAYIVFTGLELGFVPYKMEIIVQNQEQDSYIVKKCKAANDRLQEFNTPVVQRFNSYSDLIDYLATAISKWFGLKEEQV